MESMMEEKLKELKGLFDEIADITHAINVMSWDQETYMPDGGAEARAASMARFSQMAHEKFTADRIGKLLEELKPWAAEQDPDSDDARLIKVAWRNYEQQTKLPGEMVAEQSKLQSDGNMIWRKARENDDWPSFEPVLEKWLDFLTRFADLYKPYDNVYDVLLDQFEPKMKTADVREIFAAIRPQQVELIEKIRAAQQVDDKVLWQHYPEAAQRAAGLEVIQALGYDMKRGSMDKVHHPFQATLAHGDHRITVRYDEGFFNTFFFSALHEAGHAMYEQGSPKKFAKTPLLGGTSLAIHESQSRTWENQVGRSLPFWEWYFPKLQKQLPDQLKGVDVRTFYKAVNKVEPSLIRVEADEATYNLHIMLRFELEIEMMEGKVKIKDLPQVWNDRFEEYLGFRPTNNKDGVLQDVHWSFGLYGYFATYALGNLVSAQLWNAMKATNPEVDDQMRAGDFSKLFTWLTENIYQHGQKYEPQELVQRVTGSKIDGAAYIQYLNDKYSQIYDL
jgi:carboxypeptidase Taq